MRCKCKRKRIKEKHVSERDGHGQESMPSEPVLAWQSPRDVHPSVADAMPQDPEESASNEFELVSEQQPRSSARMSTHLNDEFTPRRSAVKGAVRNFSLLLRLTPSMSPNDDVSHLTGAVNDGTSNGTVNADSPATPTRSQLNIPPRHG